MLKIRDGSSGLLIIPLFFGAFSLACDVSAAAEKTQHVDPALPAYVPVNESASLSGHLNSVGSDTLANLMALWTEKFSTYYPYADIQLQAAGSSTAPPALTDGTSNLAPMSRKMTAEEVDTFESEYGYKPTAIPVAVDALAIFSHKDNPIEGLSMKQVDAMMSSTRKCGAENDIENWGQTGLTGAWSNKPIVLFGRNAVSGTYGYFKEFALCKGDFKNTINEQPGSASVVQSVASTVDGVGYAGIGYKIKGVKAIPLSQSKDQLFIKATAENALSGEYPLARNLYIYVNKAPNKPLPKLEAEFIKLVLSKEGQSLVIKDNYIALPATLAHKSLSLIQ